MREIALFSGEIYTAGTNFTRPPVVTVATNLNSASLIGIFALQIIRGPIKPYLCIPIFRNQITLASTPDQLVT